MSKKTKQLEKIRRDLAMLSDDLTYKLDDLVLGLGNLIETENKIGLDFLEKIKNMNSDKRKLLSSYLKAIEEDNKNYMDSVEDIWTLEGKDFNYALEELEEAITNED